MSEDKCNGIYVANLRIVIEENRQTDRLIKDTLKERRALFQ
jgi:hypothetical protein